MRSEESIFDEIIRAPADRQATLLEEICKGDDELRARMEKLLKAHYATTSFLDVQTQDGDTDALPSQQIGRYRLLQKIGEGGFGAVFMAEQNEPIRRRVALKVIKPGMDTKAVIARFEAERQALAIMDHPNIAKVLDAGAMDESAGSGSRPFFVMELVHGVPITEYCDRNSLSTSERLKLFIAVCGAVQHAHQKGVIHRDIKPANVMVTLHDGEPVVKVIDFGVAKALHQRLTEQTMFTEYGQMIGTPQYMSPEQAEMSGLDIDTRSDIYSLGVLLYELLTGTTPIEAKSLRAAGYAQMLEIIREQEPPKPSQRISSDANQATVIAKHRNVSPDKLHRELQGDLDWIVMKGLEKDRRRRYETASQFALDVQRSMAHQPVEAGPPAVSYRMKKFVQRHRSAVALTTALVALALTATGWAIQSYRSQLEDDAKFANEMAGAIENASLAVGRAIGAPNSDDASWSAAAGSVTRVSDLLDVASHLDSQLAARARELINQFEASERNRTFAKRVEELLIERATSMDLESWTMMESEFRSLFRERGIDLDKLSPEEVAVRIRQDPQQVTLSEALELWIGTRGQMASFGGPRVTKQIMQPWADALYAADPDPLRTGVRRIIYQEHPATRERLEKLISDNGLEGASPRSMGWLANAFLFAREPERSNEIHYLALRTYPNDLMLNFEFGLTLTYQREWNHAIRYYMRCTAIRPSVPGVWRALGDAFFENQEFERARESLQQAVTLKPDDFVSKLALAKTIAKLEDYEKAISTLSELVAVDPNHFDAWRCKAETHLALEEYSRALVAFERCHQLARVQSLKYPTQRWVDECREKLVASETDQ